MFRVRVVIDVVDEKDNVVNIHGAIPIPGLMPDLTLLKYERRLPSEYQDIRNAHIAMSLVKAFVDPIGNLALLHHKG